MARHLYASVQDNDYRDYPVQDIGLGLMCKRGIDCRLYLILRVNREAGCTAELIVESLFKG